MIYGERGKPVYFVSEHEDVTELESYRMKERLLVDPFDSKENQFFAVLREHRDAKARTLTRSP